MLGIGETETSSPVNACDDSTVIADWYEKIAVLITPPEELKKGRHASHVGQQGEIWRERRKTKIDQIRK